MGVSALVVAFAGRPDRHWLLVWLLGLVVLVGWRNEQPVLRTLYDWLPLLVILAAYDIVRSNAESLIDRAHLEPMIWFDELIGLGTAPTVRLQDALFDAQHPHWYDYVSLVGSTNLDFRSFHLNAECNFLVLDEEVGKTMSRAFERDLESSVEIDTTWRRSAGHRVGDAIARKLGILL